MVHQQYMRRDTKSTDARIVAAPALPERCMHSFKDPTHSSNRPAVFQQAPVPTLQHSTCKCVYITRTCGQDSASSRQSSSLTELSDSSTPRSTALPAFFQLPLLKGNANSKPSRQHAQRFPGTGTPLVQHTHEGNPNLPSPSTLQPLTHKSTCRKVQGSAHKTTHSARSATGLTTLAGERQLKLCTARAAVLVLSTEQQLCDP